MEKEFNLSEKAIVNTSYFWKEDIKEFIERLKEIGRVFVYGDGAGFCIDEDNIDDYIKEIDKLAGLKLITKS